MCVRMCVIMCACRCTRMCACVCMCVHVDAYVCMCVHVCACLCMYLWHVISDRVRNYIMCVCMCVHVCACVCMCVHVNFEGLRYNIILCKAMVFSLSGFCFSFPFHKDISTSLFLYSSSVECDECMLIFSVILPAFLVCSNYTFLT